MKHPQVKVNQEAKERRAKIVAMVDGEKIRISELSRRLNVCYKRALYLYEFGKSEQQGKEQ